MRAVRGLDQTALRLIMVAALGLVVALLAAPAYAVTEPTPTLKDSMPSSYSSDGYEERIESYGVALQVRQNGDLRPHGRRPRRKQPLTWANSATRRSLTRDQADLLRLGADQQERGAVRA